MVFLLKTLFKQDCVPQMDKLNIVGFRRLHLSYFYLPDYTDESIESYRAKGKVVLWQRVPQRNLCEPYLTVLILCPLTVDHYDLLLLYSVSFLV